jgi:hypothetical protein
LPPRLARGISELKLEISNIIGAKPELRISQMRTTEQQRDIVAVPLVCFNVNWRSIKD